MSQTVKPAGAGSNNTSIGNVPWENPGRIVASDDSRSRSKPTPNNPSVLLVSSEHDFDLPPDAIIDGIRADFELNENGGIVYDNAIRLVKGGVIGAHDKSRPSPARWPVTDTVISFGGPTDLWDETWTPADINDPGFGAAISARAPVNNAPQAMVDHCAITVFYHTP